MILEEMTMQKLNALTLWSHDRPAYNREYARKPYLRLYADGYEAPSPEVVSEYMSELKIEQLKNILGVSKSLLYAWRKPKDHPSYRAIPYNAWRLFLIVTGKVAAIS